MKFRKYLAKFMISTALFQKLSSDTDNLKKLFQKFSSSKFNAAVKVTYVTRFSGKMNELR